MKSSWRDAAQNILITLLALSALLLFSQTQFFRLGTTAGRSLFFTTPNISEIIHGTSSAETLSSPVRMVITDDYRHTGSLELTTTDEAFLPMKDLLAEALGSARVPVQSNLETFTAALLQPSVFFDFLHPLPLSYLAAQCATEFSSDAECQYLLISQQFDGIHLFLWDGANTFLRYATALQRSSLPAPPDASDFGSFFFAAEVGNAEHLAPCTLFPETLPDLPQLLSDSSVQNTERILSALLFNPHTNSRYTESNGTEVIIDGNRVLRLQSDGTLHYQSGDEQNLLCIPTAADTPTLSELASGVHAVLCSAAEIGAAQLYVDSVSQSETGTVLTFSYHMHGVPIQMSNRAHAATVTLSGNVISDLVYTPRRYTVSELPARLLPVTQAVAISAAQDTAALSIGYADRTDGSASPVWLAE